MIPTFVNDAAGTAAEALDALRAAGAFDVHEVAPKELTSVLREAVASHPRRIAVVGGDGTLRTAASTVCDTRTELAIIPGGTLNHFARDHGIPTEVDDAVRVAEHGTGACADVAQVGEQLFLNTSSVGAYCSFVRVRERLEKHVGYRIASFIAALRLLFSVHPIRVELEVDGETRRYLTPLVFVGVGERELKAPEFGGRIPGGRRALHVMVVRERRTARLLALAIEAVTRGVAGMARTPELDSFLVDACTVDTPRGSTYVSIDGEVERRDTPLHYRIARDAITIVVPAQESSA